jgi:hypothetical protein
VAVWLGAVSGTYAASNRLVALRRSDERRRVTVVFPFTGSERRFRVPARVTELKITAVGASAAPDFQGGKGAIVSGTLRVHPGETLYVEVGGSPSREYPGIGGFNGGGDGGGIAATMCDSTGCDYTGGGGASDVRTKSRHTAGTLRSRLVVAGGGGGAGAAVGISQPLGGAGGNAGADGGAAGLQGAGSRGGAGIRRAGGAGGPGGGNGARGASGLLGDGGRGGNGGPGDLVIGGSGGGGGGGRFGGGGGGGGVGSVNSLADAGPGGGGGGGSSLVPAGGRVTVAPSYESASVTITYFLLKR